MGHMHPLVLFSREDQPRRGFCSEESASWDEIERTSPEAYRLFMLDAGITPYLGGESLGTVQARVVPAIGQLMAANTGRVIAAVAHNCVNRAYLAHLLDMPLAKYRSIPQDNCSVNLIRHRNGRVKLVTVNAVSHLLAGPHS